MKNLNFGVEIEFTGCTRTRAAQILAEHFGAHRFENIGGAYDTREVWERQGRTWKIVSDSSIRAERKDNGITVQAGDDRRCELVTPILQYADIESLQELVRKLRKEGHAFTNKTCGIHIHVGAERFTATHLKNLASIFYSREDLIYKAIECDNAHRDTGYCKKTDPSFIQRLKNTNTIQDLKVAWYGDSRDHGHHYDDSRYHGLNLHAFWTKGTVEFRCFNSELHAGKIKAYIQLCLAIAHQALTQTRAAAKKTTVENEKYAFRCWLLRLGMIGDEFETARHHLLAHLKGDSAWKGGREQARAV